MIEVITKGGKRYTGMRVNEDAFTLQLRDAQNQFYSFRKMDLVKMTKLYEKSLMPSVVGIFSETEIEDLLAYLVSLK